MTAMIRGSEGDSRFYSPNRDVAYCYVQMVTRALKQLDVEDTWAAWVGDYLRHTGTTVDDIGETAKCLADGIADFIGDLTIESPKDALEKSGFLTSNPAAQLVICAKIGGAPSSVLNPLESSDELKNKHVERMMMGGDGKV